MTKAKAPKGPSATSSTTKRPDPVTRYAQNVVDDKIVACKLVKLACQRHLTDIEHGHKRGLLWDVQAATRVIEFFRYLRHSKGEWAGHPITLEPWQQFCIGSVFGWKRKKDGLRRFRVVYQELPRKQGKSTILSGIGLFALVADKEPGAEVYSAATRKEQARIIFGEAQRMVRSSPELLQMINVFKLNLSIDQTSSKFEPLSSDDRTLDGLNPSCVLVDELHKHRSRALMDVMDTALGARRQPLLWMITTAGDDNTETIYATENDHATKVLEGVIEDDYLFAFIATIDSKYDETLNGINALKKLDSTCSCGNVPRTWIEKSTAEACAKYATGVGERRTRRTDVPNILSDPLTQKGYAKPATIGALSMSTRPEKSGHTPPLWHGAESTPSSVEQRKPNTGQNQSPNEGPLPHGDWQSMGSATPNTTSATPSNEDAALSAARKPDLYAWITSTIQAKFGDFSAENAIPGLVFSEILRNTYFAHLPTCAAREARLSDKGLTVTIPADSWDDPLAWAKANPNLGISVKLDDLQRQAAKAKNSPPAQASFKRLRLNVRQSSTDQAIDMEVWRQNSEGGFDPATLMGRRFYAGLDMSSKTDLSAFVKLFPPVAGEDRWKVVCRFWMPQDTVEEKSDRDRVQYQRWISDGLIEATTGNVIDHAEVAAAVMEDCRMYDPVSIAFDPWNAAQISQQLVSEGAPMIEFVQGVRSYNSATKEMDSLLLSHKLDHGDHAVLTWMAHNLRITLPDRNNNVMPSKKHSAARIDGITALIMAIGRSMAEDKMRYFDSYIDRPLAF